MMFKLLLIFFLVLPLNYSKAIGGFEVPDIGVGELLGGSDKREKRLKKSSQ